MLDGGGGQSESLEALRAKVFHAIGRNLVTLQKIEGMLRFMVTVCELEGPASQLTRNREKRNQQFAGVTLGRLAEEYGRKVLPEVKRVEEPIPEEIDEINVSFRFSLGAEPARVRDRKKNLRKIVEARNNLVHKLLAGWTTTSLDSGKQVLERLDEEYSAALIEEAALREEHAAMIGLLQEMVGHMVSGDLARAMSAANLESDPK